MSLRATPGSACLRRCAIIAVLLRRSLAASRRAIAPRSASSSMGIAAVASRPAVSRGAVSSRSSPRAGRRSARRTSSSRSSTTRRCSIRMARAPSEVLAQADYNALVKASLRELFPQVEGARRSAPALWARESSASFELQHDVTDDPASFGHRRSESGYWPTTMSISISRAGSSAPRMRDNPTAQRSATRLG